MDLCWVFKNNIVLWKSIQQESTYSTLYVYASLINNLDFITVPIFKYLEQEVFHYVLLVISKQCSTFQKLFIIEFPSQ